MANIGKILLASYTLSILGIWILLGTRSFLLSFSLTCLALYLHITVTSLSNMIVNKDVPPNDTFWKLLLIWLGSISLAIYITT